MSLLIALFVVVFVVAPIVVCLMGHKEDKKQINERKRRSSILFNSTVIERTATPEEVFKTLDEAGIRPAFLQNESN